MLLLRPLKNSFVLLESHSIRNRLLCGIPENRKLTEAKLLGVQEIQSISEQRIDILPFSCSQKVMFFDIYQFQEHELRTLADLPKRHYKLWNSKYTTNFINELLFLIIQWKKIIFQKTNLQLR